MSRRIQYLDFPEPSSPIPLATATVDWLEYEIHQAGRRGSCRVRAFFPANGSHRIILVITQGVQNRDGQIRMESIPGAIAADVRRVIGAGRTPIQYIEHVDPLAWPNGTPNLVSVLARSGVETPPKGETFHLVEFAQVGSALTDPVRRPLRRDSITSMLGDRLPP